MDVVILGFIGTLAGAIVGATASILTTIITARNSAYLQENADKAERSERARAFQRDNLLEIQETLPTLMRMITEASLEYSRFFQKSENQGKPPLLSEDLNNNIPICNRKLAILNERIADDELREKLKELRTNMNRVVFNPAPDRNDECLRIAFNNFDDFGEQLGQVLRSNY